MTAVHREIRAVGVNGDTREIRARIDGLKGISGDARCVRVEDRRHPDRFRCRHVRRKIYPGISTVHRWRDPDLETRGLTLRSRVEPRQRFLSIVDRARVSRTFDGCRGNDASRDSSGAVLARVTRD